MTTAELTPRTLQPTYDPTSPQQQAARISFRQPVSTSGFIDAAWWPRSLDLTVELPPLMDTLWTAAREITRISYPLSTWNRAPQRMQIEGRSVRLGGFATSSPHTVTLFDARRRDRIDILVIAPDTDPAVAERALRLASQAEGPYRAEDILTRAAVPPNEAPPAASKGTSHA